MKSNYINLAVIGLGGRGRGNMNMIIRNMDDVRVTAVCDVYEDRVEMAAENVLEVQGVRPFTSTNYHEVLARKDLDAVMITTSWQTHLRIAIDAMKAGLWVASEVGGACTIEECWELIRTSRETGKPCMMLENCCYGRTEMALINMVRQNMFGELIHCRCGYEHDLREEVSMGHINRHYRLDNYMHRNGDVYPTHGAVPMGKLLNINRGNRFVSLVSMSSKARGLNEYIAKNFPPESDLQNYHFAQGDVVTTMLKCAHGETLVMTHDTTLPRPYSRGGYVQGTKGLWMEENNGIYFDGGDHEWQDFTPYLEKYEHPLWKWFLDEGVKGGHGGMDYLVLRSFIESVQENKEPPLDVYDFATYAAMVPLSEQSVATGSTPQPFPDFTQGLYLAREPERKWQYCLSEVCEF